MCGKPDWRCLLTMAVGVFLRRAAQVSTGGSLLRYYSRSTVYPIVSAMLLTIVGIAICEANLGSDVWKSSR